MTVIDIFAQPERVRNLKEKIIQAQSKKP